VDEPGSFDWSQSSPADRALLFRACQGIFNKSRTQRDVIERALGETVNEKYADNLRRGINSRKHAAKLFDYLRQHDPAAADQLIRNLNPGSRSPWDAFYRKYRVDNRFALALHVDHASPLYLEPPGVRRLASDDRFYLQLDSDIEGYAVGLWRWGLRWYGLGLGIGPTPVIRGRQWITRDNPVQDPLMLEIFGGPVRTGEVHPITFSGKVRYPDFVVIVADGPTTERLMQAGLGINLPVRERHLDTFPTVLETSKGPWFIAWISPDFYPRASWFDPGERSKKQP